MTPIKRTAIERLLSPLAPGFVARSVASRAQIAAIEHASATASQIDRDDANGTGGASPLLRWWRPMARDAAADILPHLPMQRAQARALARVNPIAAGAIGTHVDRVIGTGLALVPQPDGRILGMTPEQATEWAEGTKAEFSLWADSPACSWDGRATLYEQHRTTHRSRLESGDCFTLLPDAPAATRAMPYRLRLQLIEADRVGNPAGAADTATVAGGIRLSADGVPLAAHLYHRHPGARTLPADGGMWVGEWIDFVGRNGRRRLLHHMRATRPDQARGVPFLAPVVDVIKQIGRLTEAEVQAAVVSAFVTMVIEQTSTAPNPAAVFGDGQAAQPSSDGEIAMGVGAVLGLGAGETAKFNNPNRPNPNLDGFLQAMYTQIGMALGMPRELLTKVFNSSYSASKAALLDAMQRFRAERYWEAQSYCQPIYETWLAEAVAIGRIQAPGFFTDPARRWAYTRAAWWGDSAGSINPKDEVAAYLAAIEGRLMTHERAEWELFGSDWDSTTNRKIAEHQRLDRAGILPVPRAGAAAPAERRAPPADPDQSEGAAP